MAIDSKKIIKIASSLPVKSNERGIIAAFGVYVTITYNEFYFKLVSRVTQMLEEKEILAVERDLYHAVLQCGYHTFQGIRTSFHWREHISPMIHTPEDEVYALVAFTNVFGIGFIEIEKLIPGEELVTTVRNSYDSARYLEEYGIQSRGRCYMLKACTASYMDLVYGPAYPNGMYSYSSEEKTCRAMGNDVCTFIAKPIQKE